LTSSIRKSDPAAEFETLDALSVTPSLVGTTLTALSMFTPHRVITVFGAAGRPPKEARPISGDQRSDDSLDEDVDGDAAADTPKEVANALSRQLRETVPLIPITTDVLFVEYRKLPATMGLGRILRDEAKSWVEGARKRNETAAEGDRFQDMPVDAMKGAAAIHWLRRKAVEEGIVIDESALERLAATWTDDLTGAAQEIAKLRTYVGPSGHVTASVVERLEADPLFGIFTLVDAVALRNLPLGMRAWKSLLSQGKEPLMVFAMIVRQFRLMLYLQLGFESRLSMEVVLKEGNLGAGGWAVRKANDQARRLGTERIRHIYGMLRDADAAIKLGKATPGVRDGDQLVIERLMTELCAPDAATIPQSWRSAS
jgi:DNA polymerase III delta subunit